MYCYILTYSRLWFKGRTFIGSGFSTDRQTGNRERQLSVGRAYPDSARPEESIIISVGSTF